MSDSIVTGEPTAAFVGVNPYNTYGLATQGFVWAAISSVSGNFDGRLKTVNGLQPDDDGNVNVSSIMLEDYSGDVNEIRADLTVLSGDSEYRLLTNVDYDNLKRYTNDKIEELSGESEAAFAVIAEASGGWNNAQTEIESSSADWHNVETKVEETSADWDSATTKVTESSANWDSVYSTVDAASAGWQNHVTFVTVPYSEDEVLTHYTSSIDAPSVGDVLILKKQLVDGDPTKYAYSSFSFDGEVWKPSAGVYNVDGGAYSAENVFFTENLTSTYSIGSVEVGGSGHAVISAKGKNVRQVFDEIFMKEENPVATNPSVTLSYTGIGNYESGTSTTPTYEMTFNKGAYTYGPESETPILSSFVLFNGNEYSGQTGTLESLAVSDSISSNGLRMEAFVVYGDDAAVPVTNLGNQYPDAKIANGTASNVSSELKSYRKSFCGGLASKSGEVDSALVRGLSNSSSFGTPKGSSISMTYAVGDIRAVFAYPAHIGDAASIEDGNAFGANIIGAFRKIVVPVNDASGGNPIDYNVYVKDAANPNDAVNRYTMKI